MDALKNSLKSVSKIFLPAKTYAQSRLEGTRQRWDMIKPRLAGSSSVLDIGCNGGALTRAAADLGLLAIGLDIDFDSVRLAGKKTLPDQHVAFMQFRVTPESVHALPVCDVVFCLSVYHVWHREFGHESAQHILRALGAKANRRLFFEPASRQKKYGATPPAFADGDEASIVNYNRRMLSDLFGSPDNVEYLGASACMGKEPFRYLFMIRARGDR